jgi:uncharacterized protein YodC (DUF2158 family)
LAHPDVVGAVLRREAAARLDRRGCAPDNPQVQSEDQFKAGDVVRLKAGGPPMVVRAVSRDTAYCQWNAGVDLHQGTFLFSSLRDAGTEQRAEAAAAAAAALNPPRSSASS